MESKRSYVDLGVVNSGRPPELERCRLLGHAGKAGGVNAKNISFYVCEKCMIRWQYDESQKAHFDNNYEVKA